MTTMRPAADDYVPPKTDDPYGLKYLAEHPETEERHTLTKAELLAKLANLRDHHNTEGSP